MKIKKKKKKKWEGVLFCLLRRGMYDNLACVYCCFHIEDNGHAFFEFYFSKNVWTQLLLGEKWLCLSACSFIDLLHLVLLLHDLESVSLFATCSWLIWYSLNKLRHEGSCSNESLIAQDLSHLLLLPPKLRTLKVNIDVLLLKEELILVFHNHLVFL